MFELFIVFQNTLSIVFIKAAMSSLDHLNFLLQNKREDSYVDRIIGGI